MSAIGAPSLDYRRFLSDAGSGLVALVSIAISIYICGTNGECNFDFVTMLYEYFLQIVSLENNTEINSTIIIITIILFISLMLGFIVNALSYLLLDNLIDQIADSVCFQEILKILNSNSINYDGIEKFKGYFKSIDDHFNNLENKLSECESKKYAECIGEIKTRISLEFPNSVSDWGEVRGGYIMFRNFIFILLFCLFFIVLSLLDLYYILQNATALVILIILVLIFISLKFIPKSKDRIIHFLHFILLAFMAPLLITFMPIVHDPSGFLGLSKLGLETIGISIISLNILFFLSAFALTYYNYHIIIAAMYVSSDKMKVTDS